MTEDQAKRIHRERRLTVVSVSILVALSVALLFVTIRGDVVSTRERTANFEDRAAAVEVIAADVQDLQECVVQLLLIHPDIRTQMPADEIGALCPPPSLPTADIPDVRPPP